MIASNHLAQIRIGCSGWSYQHWKGTFYPTGMPSPKQFDFYKTVFDTVEINNSFYKLPSRSVLKAWRIAAPPEFLFAVKASRFITHMKKLLEPAQSFSKFYDHITELGEKLGPILFQLPPNWKVNVDRFEAFLHTIPKELRVAFEFRDASWYHEDIYTALKRHNCAFCIYELAGHHSPSLITSDFVYVRLHGPGEKYKGSYSDQALVQWALRVEHYIRQGLDVFVYFDNDQAGYAPHDARRLMEQVNSRLGFVH